MKKKKDLRENGITLIALVVTIVVLLILSSVSIQLVTNNGIFEYTNKAKIEFKRAQISEKLSLILTLEQINNSGGSEDELVEATRVSASEDEELKSMGKKVTVDPKTSTEEDGEIVDVYFYVEVDEDVYKVDMTGARFIGEKGKFPPVIIEDITNTTNSITIKVRTSRNEGGKIEIYEKAEGGEYELIKTGTGEEAEKLEYTISGLKQNTTYSIKIKATAPNGQTAEVIKNVPIGSVPNLAEGNITFTYTVNGKEIGEQEWTNQDVTVTASTNIEGYELKTSLDGEQWSNEISRTFNKNGAMYVALYDGVNYGEMATANIKNIDKVKPSIKSVQAEVVNTIQIKVTANGEDSEEEGYGKSEIKEYRIYVNEDTEPKAITQTESYTFKDLIGGTNYKFTVVAVDKAGNESDKQNENAQVSQLAGKVVDTNTSCVKYYADLDGVIENSASYEPDGVIYVDLAKGASGTWHPSGDTWFASGGIYSIEKITSDLKEYFISKDSYNGKFGNNPVISPVKKTVGTKDRFYVMALYDESESQVDYKANWRTGWVIPSIEQWAAFLGTFNVDGNNYEEKYGLKPYYWSSSRYNNSTDEILMWYCYISKRTNGLLCYPWK